MSVLDWIEVHNERTHSHLIPDMTGSLNVTIGDAVNGTFGACHSHVFGGDIKLVCDPEDFLAGKISHAVPLVSEALIGIGGNASFVFAQDTSITYGGPKIEIRRAHSVCKQSDYILPRVGAPAGDAHHAAVDHGHAPDSPLDKATCKAVAVLSTLIIGVPAACELLIRFKYTDSHSHVPGILKLCTVGITSRLMDFLKKLEECGTWAELGEFYTRFGAYIAAKLRPAVAPAVEVEHVVEALVADAAEAVAEAEVAVEHVAEASGLQYSDSSELP